MILGRVKLADGNELSQQLYDTTSRHDGRLDFVLESGEQLVGEVHHAWKGVEPNFKASCIDLKSTYKQLPLHEENHKDAVVTLWSPSERKVDCSIMKVPRPAYTIF